MDLGPGPTPTGSSKFSLGGLQPVGHSGRSRPYRPGEVVMVGGLGVRFWWWRPGVT